MNQPKPSLLTNKQVFHIPADTLLIPNDGVNMGSRTYEIPDAPIDKIYRSIDEIDKYEPEHRYDYDFYLSGGMTGYENHNFAMFHAMTEFLRNRGFRVFNPAENFGGCADLSRSTYMRKDQSALTRCGNIFLLPSWEGSQGAIGEVNNALSIPDMGIFVFAKAEDPQHKPIIIKYKR